jgi:hypothetical protein
VQATMQPTNVILFGDQTVEKRSSIQALVRNSKSSAGARRLLQQATDLVQIHFGELAKEDRAWNHEVETLLGLAEDNMAEDKPNGAIATALMCIGRLGELIVYVISNPINHHYTTDKHVDMPKRTPPFWEAKKTLPKC